MEIRVLKFEIPTEGDPEYGGAPYADRTVTVDANGHALPSSPAKAWVCVANGAATLVAGSTDHLTGSLGFSAPVNGIEQTTGAKSYCAAYYSTDNVGTTVAKRRTTSRSNYIPHPTDTVSADGYYADTCTAVGVNGSFTVNWNPVATGRGGTIVFWVVYGDDVQVAAGTGTAPHNTAAPKTYRCTDVASASGETFAPTTVFLLAADITESVPFLEGVTAASNLDFDTDAGVSFGIGTANPDKTNLAFRSLSWRDTSGQGTSASGLIFSEDYVVVGEINSAGAVASPQLFDSVSDTGFTLDLRLGVTGFEFAFLALRSETAEIKLETFTTPSATGYADQAIGAPLGNPQGVLMIQTQVPYSSLGVGMTNPVSATWGIGMGHQTTLATDPVAHSVNFQVEDNSGTSDTQSTYAPQLGYLVKKHGASATVSNFDWATHAAGSADATSVDFVTNTTATGVTNRQWAALYVGYGQQISVGLQNDGAVPSTNITVGTPTVEGSSPPQRITLTSPATVSVTATNPALAGLSSCVLTETPVVQLRVDQPSIGSLGTITDPRNEPVAAVAVSDAARAVARAEPVAASVVSDALAGWSRTEPVAATAVLDLVGSR